jgi:hypothetical protein
MAHAFLVTPAEAQALADVRGYASAGRIEVEPHAIQRMRARGVRFEDLQRALTGATACRAEPKDRWRVEGRDRDGDDLAVIAVLEDGVVVVTLF